MTDGLNHVIARMDWYMNLSNILLENSWASSSLFSQFRDAVEERIIKSYESLLQYEMQSVAYCYRDHPIVRGMKTILGFNDWEARRKTIDALEAQLEKDILQYTSREIVLHLRDLSGSASLLGDIAQDTRRIFE